MQVCQFAKKRKVFRKHRNARAKKNNPEGEFTLLNLTLTGTPPREVLSGVRVRPSRVFKGKMHFRGDSQLLSQKRAASFTHLSLSYIHFTVWGRKKKRKKNKKHCVLSFQQQK